MEDVSSGETATARSESTKRVIDGLTPSNYMIEGVITKSRDGIRDIGGMIESRDR